MKCPERAWNLDPLRRGRGASMMQGRQHRHDLSLSQRQLHQRSTDKDCGPAALELISGSQWATARHTRISDHLCVSARPKSVDTGRRVDLLGSPSSAARHGSPTVVSPLPLRSYGRASGRRKTERELWVAKRRHQLKRPQTSLLSTGPSIASRAPTEHAESCRSPSASSRRLPPLEGAPSSSSAAASQTSVPDLGDVVSSAPSTHLLHVRNIGADGTGRYTEPAALVELFSQFGQCVAATVRKRTDPDTGTDTSWALVTMADGAGVETALGHGATIAVEGGAVITLELNHYSPKVASGSNGAMGQVAKTEGNSFFNKQARQADARMICQAAHTLLLQGQEMVRPATCPDVPIRSMAHINS